MDSKMGYEWIVTVIIAHHHCYKYQCEMSSTVITVIILYCNFRLVTRYSPWLQVKLTSQWWNWKRTGEITIFLIFDRSPNLSRVLVMFHCFTIIQHFCWLTSPGGLRSESYQVASWEQWVHPKARTSKWRRGGTQWWYKVGCWFRTPMKIHEVYTYIIYIYT